MMANANMITIYCRVCHSRIRLDDCPDLYDLVTCPECSEEFEVVGLTPLRLDWPANSSDENEQWSENDLEDAYQAS